MKSAEFRVPLAVAGRLARAEMKDRATCGRGFYHSAKLLSIQSSLLSTQYSVLSTQYGKVAKGVVGAASVESCDRSPS
ncbi:MAG: hypothetical protein V7L26_11155 [Nostoc sp.]|uniref:hypothetical protein n=1 Tax=Nostoc sp. TaxID=1180 RepID=UPI002FEFCFF1